MYFIGIVITLAGLTLSAQMKGVRFDIFANPSAIVPLLAAIIGTIAATSGYQILVRGTNAALSKEYVISQKDCLKAARLFRLLSKSTLLASLANPLYIIVSLSGSFTALDAEYIGHAAALIPVSPLIGLTLVLAVFGPAAYILNERAQELDDPSDLQS